MPSGARIWTTSLETVRVTALNLHPVKSTAIRSVDSAYIGLAGLRGDREWMIVDDAGDMVSAREMNQLFTIVADTPQTGGSADLTLSAPGAETIEISFPYDGRLAPARLFTRPHTKVRYAGADADAWLAGVLGRGDLHLVWCEDPTQRSLNPEFSRSGDHAVFQDGYPVTLASTASVTQLSQWAGNDLAVQRFRANVIIDGEDAFVEDEWSAVRIGDVPFRVAKAVDRCVMTTIDPISLDRGKEPIATLAKHRRWDGKTWFAIHLIPDAEGEIRVGDEVLPL